MGHSKDGARTCARSPSCSALLLHGSPEHSAISPLPKSKLSDGRRLARQAPASAFFLCAHYIPAVCSGTHSTRSSTHAQRAVTAHATPLVPEQDGRDACREIKCSHGAVDQAHAAVLQRLHARRWRCNGGSAWHTALAATCWQYMLPDRPCRVAAAGSPARPPTSQLSHHPPSPQSASL